ARASAAVPDARAKARAWARMMEDPSTSNREFEALAEGLWDVERPALVGDYVDRYFAESVALCATRGASFSDQLGDAFPRVPLDTAQVAALERALEADVPTVLRRAWADHLDDLRRSRRGRG
nr:aminopeptidase N [Acidimicrobiia bacterium]